MRPPPPCRTPAHLAFLAELHEAGHLLSAGPLSDDG
jgi:uncharacterized protein YciI